MTGTPPARGSRRTALWITLAVVAIVVLGAGGLVWGLTRGGSDDSADPGTDHSARPTASASPTGGGLPGMVGLPSATAAIADPAERSAVTGVAVRFMEAFDTYGPGDLDARGHLTTYSERVRQVTTRSFGLDFEKHLPAAERTVATTHLKRSVHVYGSGAFSIDGDRAVALVAGTVSTSVSGRTAALQRRRYVVSLHHVDGRWLVDNLDDEDDNLPAFGNTPALPAGIGPLPSVAGTDLADAVDVVGRAVPAILSYDYRSFDRDVRAADAFSTPHLRDERRSTVRSLRTQASAQRAAVTAGLRLAGISDAGPDSVDVLVFVDQHVTKAGTKPFTLSMWATFHLVRSGSTWLVDDIRTT